MELLIKHSYESQFVVVEEFPNGGVLRRHITINETYHDYKIILSIGQEKAKAGCRVDIMPILHQDNPLREIIYPDSKLHKNPDLRVNGLLYEVETPMNPSNRNNLKHKISAGAKQADFIIISLSESININRMRAICKSSFIDHKDLVQIEFRCEGGYMVIKREDFKYGIIEPLI